MKAPQLQTSNASVRLIDPELERDTKLGVEWLNGELGRVTMRSMGNNEAAIAKTLPTTLKREAERVKKFFDNEDELNWMIDYEGKVVGSVWVALHDSAKLPSPSVHIMIGDPTMRGRGVGGHAMRAVLKFLEDQGYSTIYSRHLVANEGADKLLKKLGFVNSGKPYTSETLEFQNLVKKTEESAQ